jgi:hypothetical protein
MNQFLLVITKKTQENTNLTTEVIRRFNWEAYGNRAVCRIQVLRFRAF